MIFCFPGYSFQAPARHIITTKDVKRARLHGRPLPKQDIIDFLIENAAKLIVYKYNYETLLSEKLGFISVPVTKVLLEIMFGYKRIKGSGIRLSSQIDWTKVNEEIYAPRPLKPKTPKLKAGDRKKAGDKRKTVRPGYVKKSVAFRPEVPTGKVVVTAVRTEKKEVKVSKTKGRPSSAEKEGHKQTEITEILPPQFPEEDSEAGEELRPPDKESSQKSLVSQKSFFSRDGSVKLPSLSLESEGPTPKQSTHSRRISGSSKRGSTTSVLPEVEQTSQPSIESLKNTSSSRKASINPETSRKSSLVLPKI